MLELSLGMLKLLVILAVINIVEVGLLSYAAWKAYEHIQDQLDVLNVELVGFTIPPDTMKDVPTRSDNPEEVLSEIGSYQGPSGWH